MIAHMEPLRTTGEAIRARRLAAGISQRELAERVEVSHTQIARYEIHGAEPTVPVARRIADVLGCSIDELYPSAAA